MKRVLIVDDDHDLLEMVCMVLASSDMEISSAYSGKNLFEKVTAFQPDLVLMDIFLGDSDGRELCLELKNTESLRNIPVILYSAGIIQPESITESKADEFIPKPFQIDHLVNRVKALTA